MSEGLPSISAVVVTFESPRPRLERCVRSLLASQLRLDEVFLVDSGSVAHAQALTEIADLDDRVTVVRLGANRGFAAAVNHGVRRARGDWVLLLNDDVSVEPAAVGAMAHSLATANETCLGVVPKIMLRGHPGVIDAVGNAVDWDGSPYNIGVGQVDVGQFDRPGRVFGPCFAATLVRRRAFDLDQVGPLDESFFMYCEDIDWSWRANLFGFWFRTVPDAVVHHDHSASTRTMSAEWKLRHIDRNLLTTVVKNMSTRYAARAWLRHLSRQAARAVRGDRPLTRARLVGEALLALPAAFVHHRWARARRGVSDADVVALGDPGPSFLDTNTYEPVLDLANLTEAYRRRAAVTGGEHAVDMYQRLAHLGPDAPPGSIRGELGAVLAHEPALVRSIVDRIDPPPEAQVSTFGRPAATSPSPTPRTSRLGEGDPARVVALSPSSFGQGGTHGGGERLAELWARAVALAGGGRVDVDLVTVGPGSCDEELVEGVRHRTMPVDLPGRTFAQDSLSWAALGPIAGADLVHVNQGFTRFGQAATLAAALHGVPVVLSDHGGPTLSMQARRELGRVADAVVAYSDFGASLVDATHVVAGGVDTTWFSPSGTGPEPTRRDVVYVGRILPHKRIELAIDALPEGTRLVVCGRDYDDRYLDDLHRDARGHEVVFCHDADDESIRSLYRNALAVVLLSGHTDRYGNGYAQPELMGLTILEAMSCGTPVVVSNVGALSEFVVDGTTGYVINDASVAVALADLAADPGRASVMGAAAREHVIGRWDLETVGARLLDVYGEVVDRRRAP